ncbi:MAG: ATP-binding protein [Rubripirellula sp.]
MDFRGICGTVDDQGMVYFGGESGIVRFDGARWRHICRQPTRFLVSNNNGHLYGAVGQQSQVFRIPEDGITPLQPIFLANKLIAAGLEEKRVGGFKDFSRVGSDVYMTQTWFIARCRVLADGTDDIKVIRRTEALPSNLKFRRVFDVDGRPMVQLESMTNPLETHFGWLREDGSVDVIDDLMVDAHVVTCADLKPNEDDGEFHCVSAESVHRIRGTQVKSTSLSVLGKVSSVDYRIPIFLRPKPHGGGVMLVYPEGIVLMNRDGDMQALQVEKSGLLRPALTIDSLGRIWMATRQGVSRIDSDPDQQFWDLPDKTEIETLSIQGETLVASNHTSAFYGTLADDRRHPITELRKIPGLPPGIGMRTKAIGSEFFFLSASGVYVWDSSKPENDAVLVARRSSSNVVAVSSKRILVGSSLNTQPMFEITGGVGNWTLGNDLPTGELMTSTLDVGPDGDVWVSSLHHADGRSLLRLLPGDVVKRYPIPSMVFLFEDSMYTFTGDQQVLRFDRERNEFRQDPEFQKLLDEQLEGRLQGVEYFRNGHGGDLLLCQFYTSRWRIRRINGELRALRESKHSGISEQIDPFGRLWRILNGRIVVRPIEYDVASDKPKLRVLFSEVTLMDPSGPAVESAKVPHDGELAHQIARALPLTKLSAWQAETEFETSSGTLGLACSVPLAKSPESLLYSTRMVGISDAWTPPSYQDVFQFPALPGGKFKFEIKAMVPGGEWTSISSLHITVHPKWYQTAMFKWGTLASTVSLFLFVSVYAVRAERKRVAHLQQVVKTREESESQLRESQARLVQRERLQAFGEMAAGIAHDINNLLSPITVYSELISIGHVTQDDIKQYNRVILTCVNDASEIIARLSPLYRRRCQAHELCDLEVIVAEVAELLRATAKLATDRGKEIQVMTETSPATMTGSPAEIREILLNLGHNAVDAIEGSGSLWLRCRTEDGKSILEVEDTGVGMPEDILQKCTETFFSSKGEFGTGLGLATSNAIVNSYDGTMDVHSQVGVGTRICIAFNQQRPKTEETGHFLDIAIPFEPCRVLLVDDVARALHSADTLLRSLGCKVVSFGDGSDAMQYLRNNNDIDVLITDYQMPGLNGLEFCTQARNLHPGLKTIITSGYKPEDVLDKCDAFVAKPTTSQSLRHAIATVQAMAPRVF